jgi:hypothetical protein
MGGRLAVELILHIGTHKSGTSALQYALRLSRQVLIKNSVYYACPPRSKNANELAQLVAKGRSTPVQDFLRQQVDEAHAGGANKIIISAESLYAMSTFFHKFNGRSQDYWRLESDAIELFKGALPPDITTKVLVFFRRPDHFLESVYRQFLRSTQPFSMPIDKFRVVMREALDYYGHFAAWRAVFPNCTAYTYEEVERNIVEFFLRNVLQLKCLDEFKQGSQLAKFRWSRDVVEYKKLLDQGDMSSVDRKMNIFALTRLALLYVNDSEHQDFLEPEARIALLRDLEPGNLLLRQESGMKPFPVLSDEEINSWAPYPGLSPKKLQELQECHAQIRRSATYRIERLAQGTRLFIAKRLEFIAWIVLPLGRLLLRRHKRRKLAEVYGPEEYRPVA